MQFMMHNEKRTRLARKNVEKASKSVQVSSSVKWQQNLHPFVSVANRGADCKLLVFKSQHKKWIKNSEMKVFSRVLLG